ncbi:spore coat protein SP65-like [Procambarus clarkii]|uniref:spore coat protein SP65-like n=1 Tax=Procambarus clarkii TaxID=6728 RepID=UPI001E671526|nr:integumentary mucin C.1-like [Procambarus clarkii]
MTMRLLQVSLSVAWVAALLCVTRVSAGTCDPVCTDLAPRSKTVDPYDCTRYYICISDTESSTDSFPCPVGTSFNSSTHDCTGALPCTNTCKLLPCPTTCKSDPGTFPDTTNCSSYYICTGGSTLGPFECPTVTPYFDSVAQTCSGSQSVCCSDPCVAYCQTGEVQTQDPFDCHKFYYCIADGPVDPLHHGTCPSEANFDVSEHKCVAGADCNTLCEVTPAPGTDTTPKGTTTPATSVTTPATSVTTPTTTKTTPATSTNTPTSTIPTPTTPGCLDSMTCTSKGYFPMCTTCVPQFFDCRYVGQPATVNTCIGDLVFNPDPANPYCVLPDKCPYTPTLT